MDTVVEPDDSISCMGIEYIDESEPSVTGGSQAPRQGGREVNGDTKTNGQKAPGHGSTSSVTITDKKSASQESGDADESKQRSSAVRKPRRSIFIGYSPEAGFHERKLVLETVKQIKLNGLSDNIWFDADERVIESCCCLAYTLEAVEKCRAALLFLSESFFTTRLSLHVGETLVERLRDKEGSVNVFSVLVGPINAEHVPESSAPLFQKIIDLTEPQWRDQSIAEQCTAVVGNYMLDLERYASALVPYLPPTFETEITGRYKKSSVHTWSVGDLQEWLTDLGVREFYRQSFAEQQVDGFLLVSMTDEDLVSYMATESRVVRKKITNQVLTLLDKEHKQPQNWHLRARSAKTRLQTVYLIFDPSDNRLGQTLRNHLSKKGLIVHHHTKLGQSKDEFLKLNVTHLSTASHVLLLLTETAVNSPFVYHEVMFSDWLGKKVITLLFKNGWYKLRPALRAILGDAMGVDFETRRFNDSMSVVEHVIRPSQTMPGLVLEQTYLDKMSENVQPLRQLVRSIVPAVFSTITADRQREVEPVIFISFQWDMMGKVEELRRFLEHHNMPCWTDIVNPQHGAGSASSNGGAGVSSESLQSNIQRNMKSAKVVLCCVTPKYVQSNNCAKDLALAEMLHKPILPVMLRVCTWPPDNAPSGVKKILSRCHYIDLSNEKLVRPNLQVLLEKLRKIVQIQK